MARSFSRTYTVGTRLVYERGPLLARAVVAPRSVVLQPESYVRLGLGLSVGARFAAIHREFLAAAGVVALGHALGKTTRAVESPSAAALIKRVSAGRVHNADRWQPYPPHPLGHRWE